MDPDEHFRKESESTTPTHYRTIYGKEQGTTMKTMPHTRLSFLLGLLTLFFTGNVATAGDTIRVGHFPNITHVQGLVAQHLSRTGHGWFEERLGKDVKIEWYVYNAGPSAMEAILSNSIDLTYV